jgi:hypothetical protein
VAVTAQSDLLPIGTRIRFTKTLTSGPDEYSPGNHYATKGDGGVITGHGTSEGYWVKWDGWNASFGASRDEFELEACPICSTTKRTPAGYLDCDCHHIRADRPQPLPAHSAGDSTEGA